MDIKTIMELGGIGMAVVSAFLFDKWQGIQLRKEMDELKQVNQKQWDAIDKVKKDHTDYANWAGEKRLEIELKIAAQSGTIGKLDARLESIEKKIDELISEFKHGK